MKWLAAITLCAATAFAGTASIVASWPSPCSSSAYGIDYYGGYLYHADSPAYKIYKTNTAGSILETIPTTIRPFGIDRTQIEFWTDDGAAMIYRLETTGTFIRSFKGPGIISGGVAFGEGFIWYTSGPVVFKLTPNGTVVKSFELPGGLHGINWYASNLWIADWSKGKIYQTTEAGRIIESITPVGRPYGVTWDGSYLWYTANRYVYQAHISPTSIAPASLGRVKALYR